MKTNKKMVNGEIHEYLRSGIEKGFSIKDLKRELIKAGHEIKVVEEEAKEFERKNAFKLIYIFGIVIVVSLIVILGFKGLIFENEKNVVGVDLNSENLFLNFKELIKQCNLDTGNEKLCCFKDNKLTECSKNNVFAKDDYLIYNIRTNEFKDKLIYDKYRLCAFTGLVENKNSNEERVFCSVLLDKNYNNLVRIYGYIKTNNLISLFEYSENLDLSNKENILKNKNRAKEVYKIEVDLE